MYCNVIAASCSPGLYRARVHRYSPRDQQYAALGGENRSEPTCQLTPQPLFPHLSSHQQVPPRLLMGPGPTNSHPRILAAQALPLLGHMHPPFIAIMDEIKKGLQYL